LSVRISSDDIASARELQSRHYVFDCHSDVPLLDVYPRRLRGETEVMKRIQLPRHREGLVNGAIFTVHCDCMKWATQYAGALKETLEEIDYLYSEEAESRGEFVIAKSGTDLEKAWKNNRFAALMGLEGGKAIEGSLEALRCLQKLGVRSFGITHNIRNQLADGAGVPQNYGLTDLGKKVVEEVDKLHMVLDLVHLSEKGFYDALEASSGTPIISHTGCRELNPFDHGKVPWRNVTDKQIEKLGDRGGVMGIAFLKAFVTGKDESTVEDVIRHLEHAIKLIGIDHVGIGPDYVDYGLPENQLLLGEKDPLGTELDTKGVENITKIPYFTAALIKHGYSETEISKILGGNFLNLFKKILG
jgi:membrane dipeptidase